MHKSWLFALLLCVGSGDAWACGRNFDVNLLTDRDGSLATLWDGSFAIEARHAVAAPKGLRWSVMRDEEGEYIQPHYQTYWLSQAILTAEQSDQARRARGADSAEEAFTLAQGLSASLQNYTAASKHWYAEEYEAAASGYANAAKGKATAADPWPLIGEYMLARSLAAHEQMEPAFEAFQRVRDRVAAGQADPLNLGVESLGTEGRMRWDHGHWNTSLKLYAQQYAAGDPGAELSLRWLTDAGISNQQILTALLKESPGRDLMMLHAFTHFPVTTPVAPDADDVDERIYADQALYQLLQALESQPANHFSGAERIAALAYRQARYDLAERFIARAADGPLTHWVKAKLALRADQLDQAADHLRAAAQAFPRDEYWTPDKNRNARQPYCRVQAERAILALGRGDILDSMTLFLEAGPVYWLDAAYVAERVLTTDELTALIARLDSIRIPTVKPDEIPYEEEYVPPYYTDPRAALRNLAARRLMREQQYDAALKLFSSARLRRQAEIYVDTLRASESVEGIDRARKGFTAAKLARRNGLDLLGFETDPDWASNGANYNDEGPSGLIRSEDLPTRERRWLADRETAILQNHTPLETRFSYRLTAAEIANRAADDLPPDSQAFAAVLCTATSWLLAKEPELARKYYYRYRDEGRAMPWGSKFGQDCPQPKWPSEGV